MRARTNTVLSFNTIRAARAIDEAIQDAERGQRGCGDFTPGALRIARRLRPLSPTIVARFGKARISVVTLPLKKPKGQTAC
jgi:hypothetical protein